MASDPDRPFGRDCPIVVAVCPVCEDDIETEHLMERDDTTIAWWGDVAFHAGCVPKDLRACVACDELEEVRRLDSMGQCYRCKCGTLETKNPAA